MKRKFNGILGWSCSFNFIFRIVDTTKRRENPIRNFEIHIRPQLQRILLPAVNRVSAQNYDVVKNQLFIQQTHRNSCRIVLLFVCISSVKFGALVKLLIFIYNWKHTQKYFDENSVFVHSNSWYENSWYENQFLSLFFTCIM